LMTNEKVAGAPVATEAIQDFFDYVEKHEAVCLVGHYVGLDHLVLKSELKREKLGMKKLFTIDTLDSDRQSFLEQLHQDRCCNVIWQVGNDHNILLLFKFRFIAPSYDMRDLERYAMTFGTRIYDRHSAVGDALTTAYLFTELLQQFKDRGHSTWGELVNATDSQMRSMQF
jgi:DNA polymerase III subunit epsilon